MSYTRAVESSVNDSPTGRLKMPSWGVGKRSELEQQPKMKICFSRLFHVMHQHNQTARILTHLLWESMSG